MTALTIHRAANVRRRIEQLQEQRESRDVHILELQRRVSPQAPRATVADLMAEAAARPPSHSGRATVPYTRQLARTSLSTSPPLRPASSDPGFRSITADTRSPAPPSDAKLASSPDRIPLLHVTPAEAPADVDAAGRLKSPLASARSSCDLDEIHMSEHL